MRTGHQPDFDSKAFGPFGPLFQTYASALESFGRAYGVANPFSSEADPQDLPQRMSGPLKAAARSQLAWLALVNRRAQAYMQVPTRLAQCRTPQDVMNEHMAFWRTASEQYTESYRKMFDAWTSADLVGGGRSGIAVRDYISFNGTGGKDADVPSARPEPAGKQRRVA